MQRRIAILSLMFAFLMAGSALARVIVLNPDELTVKKQRPTPNAELFKHYNKQPAGPDGLARVDRHSQPVLPVSDAQQVEFTIKYDDGKTAFYSGRPVPGDTCGVVFTPPTDCKILSTSFWFNGNMGGFTKLFIWKVRSDFDPSLYYDNDEAGATPGPSPVGGDGELIAGPIEITFDNSGLWQQVVYDDYDYTPEDLDVGKSLFYVGYEIQPGNDDLFYPSILGDNEDSRPYTSLTYLTNPGGSFTASGWAAYGIDWMIRTTVDMYGDPPPVIANLEDLPDTYTSQVWNITAKVTDQEKVGEAVVDADPDSVQLFYQVDGGSWTKMDMTVPSGTGADTLYSADIPAQSVGTTVAYYIRAVDNQGSVTIDPSMDGYTFTVREPTEGVSILLVSAATGDIAVEYYEEVLDAVGYKYDYWSVDDYGRPMADVLAPYTSVIWHGGAANPSGLPLNDETEYAAVLGAWLDAGGNMYICSSDWLGIAFDPDDWDDFIAEPGTFMYDYVGIAAGWSDNDLNEAGDASTDTIFAGVTDDVISGDFIGENTIEIDPEAVGESNYSDAVTPRTDITAWTIFTNELDDDAGIAVEEAYKLVFLPWIFEAITSDAQKIQLMTNILTWFGESPAPIISDVTKIYNTNATTNLAVSATVTDKASTLSWVRLHWMYKTASATVIDSVAMTTSDSVYTGMLEASGAPVDSTITYWVAAQNAAGMWNVSTPMSFYKLPPASVSAIGLYVSVEPYAFLYPTAKVDSLNKASLNKLGIVYDTWDFAEHGVPDISTLAQYGAVVWLGAYGQGAFDDSDVKNPLALYLDGGGNLIFAHDEAFNEWYGWDAYTYDWDEYAETDPDGFSYNYLQVAGISDVWPDSMMGVADDPITGTLSTSYFATKDTSNPAIPAAGYPGGLANWADALKMVGQTPSELDAPVLGLRFDDGTYKVVVLSFILGATAESARDVILQNSMAWFLAPNSAMTAPAAILQAPALSKPVFSKTELTAVTMYEDSVMYVSTDSVTNYVSDTSFVLDLLEFDVASDSVMLDVPAKSDSILLSSPPNWFGVDTLWITFTNPYGLSATASWVVTVLNVNDAPARTDTIPDWQIGSADDLVLDLTEYFEDIDDPLDSLDLAAVGANFVLTVGDSLMLTIEAATGVTGLGQIIVTVSDTAGAVARDTFKVNVKAASGIVELQALPKKFALSQNFPNPFNPETSIEVALPLASQVRLEIYNITGQRVRVLMQGRQEAGFHRVLWNGKDNNGREVPSGVYFYAISAVEFEGKQTAHREVKKMVLIK